jgi:hypothetical protein
MAETEKATPAKSNTSAGKTAKTAKAVKAAKSAKPAAKPAVKAAKPAAKAPKADQAQQQPAGKAVKAIKSVKAANPKDGKEEKARRVKKDKVVRDSFTMPKSDYMKIAELKQRCLDAGVSVKKSELLRAGLALLAEAQPKRLIAAVSALDTVKTGRPAKS